MLLDALKLPFQADLAASEVNTFKKVRHWLTLERRQHLPHSNALVINGHPDPRPHRYCAALAQNVSDACRSAGWQTHSIALGEGAFGNDGGLLGEVDALEAYTRASYVILVFPMWLGKSPPVVADFVAKGEERRENMADAPSRRVQFIVTMDMPALAYRCHPGRPGKPLALHNLIPDDALFIGSVSLIPLEKRIEWLRIAKAAVKSPAHLKLPRRGWNLRSPLFEAAR